MSEYWKSNPRKHCDYCKCWIADNKPCVEAHERGKKHQENVAKRLQEIGKKGKADHETQKKMDSYMMKMEQAALQAYKKDIEENPDLMASKLSKLAGANNATIVIKDKSEEKNKSQTKKNKGKTDPTTSNKPKWKEVKTAEGRSYYWNTITSETVWNAPPEGYVSLAEQKSSLKRKHSNKQSISSRPAPRQEGFSTWETVIQNDTEMDLELPQIQTKDIQVPQLSFKKRQLNFEEKVVTLSEDDGSSSSTTFKKRKRKDNQQNMRQRIE